MPKDILVKTENPDALDKILNQFGAALVGGGMPSGYSKIAGCFGVRCFGDSGFVKFMITNQGYGEVIKEFDDLVI